MKKRITLVISFFSIIGCTELEVEGLNLPDVRSLEPSTINTRFEVAHLTADPDELEEMFRRYSKDVAIKATITYYDQKKQTLLQNLPIQIEVKGNASAKYSMKSIGVLFNKPLNNDSVQLFQSPKLINGHSIRTLYSIRFRNSGQDFGRTMIKDLAYTELAIKAGLDVELMYYKPVQVFINSEYYGLMNLRTENETFGIAGLVSSKVSAITTMDSQKGDADFEWESGPEAAANDLLEAIDNQNAEKLKSLMDVSSFIDYVIYEDYIGNYDWPNNNLRLYSVSGSPFRFMLYDTDYAADRPKDPKLPALESGEGGMAETYQALKQIPGFYDQLRGRQKELYKVLTPERFNTIMERLADDIEADIPYLIARHQQPGSMLQWYQQLEIVKHNFEVQDKYIREKHELE